MQIDSNLIDQNLKSLGIQSVEDQRVQQPQQTKKKKGNIVTNNLPLIGGIAGGLAAAPFTGGLSLIPALALAGAGAAVGAGAGEYGRQKAFDEKTDLNKIGKEALISGAGEVVGGGIGRVAGKVLSKGGKLIAEEGENLALKALRPTKTQLANFAKQNGEEMLSVIKRNKIQGYGSNDIMEKAIKPIQESFDNIVKNQNVNISKETLDRNFYAKIKPLLESGDVDDVKVAEKLIQQYDNISQKELTLDAANKLRQNFDLKVKDYKVANPLVASEKRVIADALRDSVRETAEQAGLKGANGESLKDLGHELSKLYSIHDMAFIQEQLGKGNLPVGILKLLAVGGGGSMGGPVGAGTTLVATMAMNNPTVIRKLSQMAMSAGDKQVSQQLMSMIGGAIGQGVSRTGMQDTTESPTEATQDVSFQNDTTLPTDTTEALPDPRQAVQDQYVKALEWDMQNNGGKNASLINNFFEAKLASIPETEKPSKLSDTAIKSANDFNSAITGLTNLKQQLNQSKSKTGPVGGLQALNPYDTEARALQANIDRVRQMVGKALEGGVLRKEDEEKYKKILPTIKDTPAVANAKIESLLEQLYAQSTNYAELQNTRGGGTLSLPTDTSQALY